MDIELNDTGILQATEIGRLLKNEKVDYIYSSKLKRAFTTAEYIRQQNINSKEIDISKNEWLNERGYGSCEGMHISEYRQKNEQEKLECGVESIQHVRIRCGNFCKDMHAQIKKCVKLQNTIRDNGSISCTPVTVIVVSHGAYFNQLVKYFKETNQLAQFTSNSIENCECHYFSYAIKDNAKLKNNIFYIDNIKPVIKNDN
ncbi:hypothetical protein A3Q56_04542 [Intoshia linei]|uniref:Fructose-2,6-bisphosphatase TIGAR n=1 Tax=Intoshia linei TaxID=1819745 RepID=A0A177B0H3_9BILA|nr:hypothetical protein A3Q56_04542 [Intoshia linei]